MSFYKLMREQITKNVIKASNYVFCLIFSLNGVDLIDRDEKCVKSVQE